MKSIEALRDYPAGAPLSADDVKEYHAARLLLLLYICGTNRRIDGLTKLAKLDFFVRYPSFFADLMRHLGKEGSDSSTEYADTSMIRYHYGPWDKRYYHVIPFLEACGLLSVEKTDARSYAFVLTQAGLEKAKVISRAASYELLVSHMKRVKSELGRKSGNKLKELIYEVFDEEVGQAHMGSSIRANQ